MAGLLCLLYLVLFIVVGNEAILLATSETNNSAVVYKKMWSDKLLKQESLQAQPSVEHESVYGHYYPGGHHGYGDGYNVHHYHPPPYDPTYAIKSLLVPLAGVALLGAAAVFASNPVLLQLGVVSGRRRRRNTEQEDVLMKKLREVAVLETFMHQLPKESLKQQEKQILASYLSCSGVTACLQRLFCEVERPVTKLTDLEQKVLNIVMSEIYDNEYVDNSIKENMVKARNMGLANYNCAQFYCSQL